MTAVSSFEPFLVLKITPLDLCIDGAIANEEALVRCKYRSYKISPKREKKGGRVA